MFSILIFSLHSKLKYQNPVRVRENQVILEEHIIKNLENSDVLLKKKDFLIFTYFIFSF